MIGSKIKIVYALIVACSFFWLGNVCYVLLRNLLSSFLGYENLPFILILTTSLSVVLSVWWLEKKAAHLEINTRKIRQVVLISLLLLALSAWRHLYDYSGIFCGLSILNNELDPIFQSHAKNLGAAEKIKHIIIGISIIVYTNHLIEKYKAREQNQKSTTDDNT